MSRYAWLITKDVLHTNDPHTFERDDAGTVGPSGATDEQEAALKRGEGTPFRMRDDDGEVYYLGLFLGDSEGEEGFGPLDDFGTPNAGATTIEYKRGNVWEQF